MVNRKKERTEKVDRFVKWMSQRQLRRYARRHQVAPLHEGVYNNTLSVDNKPLRVHPKGLLVLRPPRRAVSGAFSVFLFVLLNCTVTICLSFVF
jgi:hypothetical protein